MHFTVRREGRARPTSAPAYQHGKNGFLSRVQRPCTVAPLPQQKGHPGWLCLHLASNPQKGFRIKAIVVLYFEKKKKLFSMEDVFKLKMVVIYELEA